VYVVGNVDDSVVVFDRDPTTGHLTFVERQHNGVAGVTGLNNPQAVVVSPDGTAVYATAVAGDNVVAFHRGVCGDGTVNPGEQCDDGNLVDGDCSARCQATGAGSPCDDGAFCTVDDICQNGTCHGTARDCSTAASDQCHQGACDEAIDACVPEPKTDGASCSDADECTLGDTWQAGVCMSNEGPASTSSPTGRIARLRSRSACPPVGGEDRELLLGIAQQAPARAVRDGGCRGLAGDERPCAVPMDRRPGEARAAAERPGREAHRDRVDRSGERQAGRLRRDGQTVRA